MTKSECYTRTQPKVGDRAQVRKTITVADQTLYIGISGNMHPLYADETHARRTEVGARVVYELVLAALASHPVAELAGPYRRIGGLRLEFGVPARVGDTVAAQAQVIETTDETVRCRILCVRDGFDDIVAEGTVDLVEIGVMN